MTNTTTNTPETLLSDSNSMAFFVLRDESIVLAKRRDDVPYYRNRQTYLSAGRFSPERQMVIFYPDPVNPRRAMELLIEGMHIDSNFSFQIQGGAVHTKVAQTPKNGPLEHLDGVRKREAEVLLEKGLKVQNGSQDSVSQKD